MMSGISHKTTRNTLLTVSVSRVRSRLSGRRARWHRRLGRHPRGRGRSPAMARWASRMHPRGRRSPCSRGTSWMHPWRRGHPGARRGRHSSWREASPRRSWRHVRPASGRRRHRSHGMRARRTRGQWRHSPWWRHRWRHVAPGPHHVRRRRHRVDAHAGHGSGRGVSEQLVRPVSLGQRVLGGQQTLSGRAVPLALGVLLECVGD